ncbi:MAG: hypothetical protein ACJAWZ_003697, partial [Paracoccaceae bacterium]
DLHPRRRTGQGAACGRQSIAAQAIGDSTLMLAQFCRS